MIMGWKIKYNEMNEPKIMVTYDNGLKKKKKNKEN